MSKYNPEELLKLYKVDFLDALTTLEHSWNKLSSQSLPELNKKNLDDFESCFKLYSLCYQRTWKAKILRISSEQIQQFHSTLQLFLKGHDYELFLYGSRTQDHLKGGDIDLLIISSDAGVHAFDENHLDILVHLKKQFSIGDRRIDIKAASQNELENQPFLKMIARDLVKI